MELRYNKLGKGSPLIFLHGLLASSANLMPSAKLLSSKFEVFLPDLRNHGKSPHHPNFDNSSLKIDAINFIEKHTAQPVLLVGHSLGGRIAMSTAFAKPDLIDRLIIIDIAPITYPNIYNRLIDSMLKIPLAKIKTRQEALSILNDYLQPTKLNDPLYPYQDIMQLSTFLLTNLYLTKQGYNWRCNLPAIKNHLDQLLKTKHFKNNVFNQKTLFLAGEKSTYITPSHHKSIYTYFPLASIKSIKQAGHFIHIDQPEALVKAIFSFCEV